MTPNLGVNMCQFTSMKNVWLFLFNEKGQDHQSSRILAQVSKSIVVHWINSGLGSYVTDPFLQFEWVNKEGDQGWTTLQKLVKMIETKNLVNNIEDRWELQETLMK